MNCSCRNRMPKFPPIAFMHICGNTWRFAIFFDFYTNRLLLVSHWFWKPPNVCFSVLLFSPYISRSNDGLLAYYIQRGGIDALRHALDIVSKTQYLPSLSKRAAIGNLSDHRKFIKLEHKKKKLLVEGFAGLAALSESCNQYIYHETQNRYLRKP